MNVTECKLPSGNRKVSYLFTHNLMVGSRKSINKDYCLKHNDKNEQKCILYKYYCAF